MEMAHIDDPTDESRRDYPFSVDTWPPLSSSSRRRTRFFLTHAHLDHTRGISSSFAPIYCTPLTAALVLLRCPQLHKSDFAEINIEEPRLIDVSDRESFTVTAYDANHCPGAVMFLFEGSFGTVLHTGDCRLTPECYARLPRRLFGGLVDCLFLDCTFAKEAVRMPQRDEAVNQVKQCIWNHPDATIVYLACDLLGQEFLLKSLSCAFGFKVYVDKDRIPDFYGSLKLIAPDLVTDDPSSTRLHVCEGFPKLYEKAKQKFKEAHMKGEAEPLFVRPSAQWYTYGERLEGVGSGLLLLEQLYQKGPSLTKRHAKHAPKEAERDAFGIWHVCYSMHSSQEELDEFVSKLKPRQVISTTPNCRATELASVKLVKCNYFVQEKTAARNIPALPAKKSGTVQNGRDETVCEKTEHVLEESPVALFGMAVIGLPPSPPLSFSSEREGSPYRTEDTAVGKCDQRSPVFECPSIPGSQSPGCGPIDRHMVNERSEISYHEERQCFLLRSPMSECPNIPISRLQRCAPTQKQMENKHVDISYHEERQERLLRSARSESYPSVPGSQTPGCAPMEIRMENKHVEISYHEERKSSLYPIIPNGVQQKTSSILNSHEAQIPGALLTRGSSSNEAGGSTNSVMRSIGLDETTKKVYRSLNMMIPRPIPSLLELDREIKRYKF